MLLPPQVQQRQADPTADRNGLTCSEPETPRSNVGRFAMGWTESARFLRHGLALADGTV